MSIGTDQLLRLHQQVGQDVAYFKALIVHDEPCSGLIYGAASSKDMTSADYMVRMGQLLCRWGLAQTPVVGMCVGVEIGQIFRVSLPNSGNRMSYHGPVVVGAQKLAQSTRQEGMVHMSTSVRDQLSALRFLPVIISPSASTYYLDAFTEVLREAEIAQDVKLHRPSLSVAPVRSEEERAKVETMSRDTFIQILQKHAVDLTKFGKGAAKTLDQFYDAVVQEEKCYLQVQEGVLKRFVELVRISIRIRDDNGKLKELRIQSEKNSDGSRRERNQPLAMVMRVGQAGNWQQAVSDCFMSKFELSEQAVQSCLVVAKDAYSYEENYALSDRIPGIMTTYKTHNVSVVIKDRKRKELDKIGLPDGKDFKTQNGATSWTWASVTNFQEEELMVLLQNHGIDVSEFSWQSFAELCEEVYEKKHSTIQAVNGELVRQLRIIKVQLSAQVLNLKHLLVMKSKRQNGRTFVPYPLRTPSMRMRASMTWEDAVAEVLWEKLGIDERLQQEGLFVNVAHFREEVEFSQSFPGLKTVYSITEVNADILNPQDLRWQNLGLPSAVDSIYTRKETTAEGLVDLIITRWGWTNVAEVQNMFLLDRNKSEPSLFDNRRNSIRDEERVTDQQRRQVTSPEPYMVSDGDELIIKRVMEQKETEWFHARKAAERIRDKDYSCEDFYKDITTAFPELRLYCVQRQTNGKPASVDISQAGGRTGDDEYQRTMGALFCVFWLMRMHLDGKESFSFGLDNKWQPRDKKSFWEAEQDDLNLQAEYEKRLNFYQKTDWVALEDLVVQSGMLLKAGGPHDVDRTLAMLVLMTIHDVMKLDILRPTVAQGIKEFSGYYSGEQIGDHDIALSYVLEHCPTALPSFNGLRKDLKGTIKFTHSKMDYNMGWLVQGEAPPGALFRSFRKVILSGAAKDSAADIAFYFVHWFADLAGAEAYPMQGCEKFVLKFPLKVLTSFIDSFSTVWNLGPKTETETLQDYLVWRWKSHDPKLGDPPTGPGSIAKMRLVLMAQGDSKEVLSSLAKLPKVDREAIEKEMAMTGCETQHFTRDSVQETQGPAILVYYGPALLQKAGRKDPEAALKVLAEVFKAARALWPLNSDDSDKSVIVRIDVLKEMEASQLLTPDPANAYVLLRGSNIDGQVKKVEVGHIHDMDKASYQILHLVDSEDEAQKAANCPPPNFRPKARFSGKFAFLLGR